ncbi:coiled-coil domain-containing protein 17-like isoform X2 [Physella acuta]|uniref:coiled-coil domain-containing protein 17-like isoform X2 n=1 Tax=Physella acuta TaxID=109671 RepID=UPI0027DB0F88|nr:coiled-coil domain-containing protein 17-like isoform X2 [Physella acuta]XP_059161002.1 coiled-coil domain-containing protein 17-like isoform X2 [Physella acuta]
MDEALAMHWRCYDCNMTFSNPSLLQKHRSRFCVGGGLGDPDQLMLRRGFRSELPPDGGDVPDDPDVPRYNHHADPKAQQLAESHGRNMEHLQNRNRDLERQREEIRRRLDDLGRRPIKDDDSMNALLQELKDQEARNQKMLEELRRLMATQHYPVAVEGKKQHQYIYPIYYGNSLVAEIIAVRQAYLQNGGNDPDILQQLAQMQAEAQAIDDSLRNRPAVKVKDKHQPDHSLFTLELENERLQRQLLLLQEQNLQAKHRRKDDREDELERDIRRMQQDHLRKMYELQREIEKLRHESIYLKIHDKPSKIIVHQPPPIQVSAPPPVQIPQPQIIEVDRLAPYDYSAGFAIFYDFVLNLDPRISAVRLIVGLHNTQAKLGEPTILPLVYTEPSTRANSYSAVNAVIGARQPVPRCPPQPDLGIVVELQAAGSAPGSEHDQSRLITRAWTKIPLFDSQDRLMTGRHRMPLRAVPLKPYIPMHELNSIPQYGESELYYRIVNMRDAQSQSMATIAATNQDMYQVAPVGGLVLTQVTVSPVPPPPSASPPSSPMDYFSPRVR